MKIESNFVRFHTNININNGINGNAPTKRSNEILALIQVHHKFNAA